MKTYYFDHAATAPMRKGVLEAMMPFLTEEYGNPLSPYGLGNTAKGAVQDARQKVASLIGASPAAIIFTATGAESNNFALRGIALARAERGKHLIVSKVEHHSVLNPARFLEKSGFVATYLSCDKHGRIEPDALREAIIDETQIVSITLASPEVGTIQPIKELAAIAHERGVLFHTDAVAAAGNIPLDVAGLGVDLMSISAHTFGGPKGVAALYVKEGMRIVPLIYGGIQEGGRRAGTENVPAIVGMGAAAELAAQDLPEAAKLVTARDKLIEGVMKIKDVVLTGHPTGRLPGHASFCVEFIEGEAMLLMLSAKGLLSASGSACSSRALKASPVLLSMGIPSGLAQGSVVFTMGTDNAPGDVDYLLGEFPGIIQRLREISPYAGGWGSEEGSSKCTPKK